MTREQFVKYWEDVLNKMEELDGKTQTWYSINNMFQKALREHFKD